MPPLRLVVFCTYSRATGGTPRAASPTGGGWSLLLFAEGSVLNIGHSLRYCGWCM